MRIFLVGYMGSGKTTLGKQLAAHMGLEFMDMDARIEGRYGKTIPQIFAGEGEERFREYEKEILREVAALNNVVVATGGGLPCFHGNMDVMNDAGITVYLKMTPAALAGRLTYDGASRPVLGGRRGNDMLAFITKHLAEREPCYAEAKFTVNGLDADAGRLAATLLRV